MIIEDFPARGLDRRKVGGVWRKEINARPPPDLLNGRAKIGSRQGWLDASFRFDSPCLLQQIVQEFCVTGNGSDVRLSHPERLELTRSLNLKW